MFTVKSASFQQLDPRGKNVTQVSAINANSPSSPVAYYFFYLGGTGSNRTNDFEINTATGLITTARDIGYEGGTNFVVSPTVLQLLIFQPP